MTRTGRDTTPFVTLDRTRCEACWECIAVCPEAVLGKIDVWFHRHVVVRDGDRCQGCRRCIRVCAAVALSERGGGRQASTAVPSFLAGDPGHDAEIL